MNWELSVINASSYHHAQQSGQVCPLFFVGFIFSGLKRFSVDGCEIACPQPMLQLLPQGTKTEFEFGIDRENWVVFAQSDDIRRARPSCLEIRFEDHWVELPCYQGVDPAQAQWWRGQFMQIHDLLQSPTPRSRLLAQLMVMQVIQQFVEPPPLSTPTAEHRLKHLIDHDLSARRTIAQLAEQCDYSLDHLRVLFEKRFGLTPIAYRQRVRMARAMQEITRSRRAIKQIASSLGFSQVAHFSAAFKQAYAMTPSQAVARFRQH